MSLGTTISRLRTERSLSQEDLADALGVFRQSVSKWETDGSVPELDKLVKLARLFGVTLDQLVLKDAPDPAPAAPADPPPVEHARGLPGRKIAGTVLLCMGFAVVLVLAALGGLLEGLILSLPFLLCGAVCFLFKRRTGLWCGWVVFLLADLYLRFATGINWRLVLHTLSFTPEMNYLRLAIAWVQLLGTLLLMGLTVFSFRRGRLDLSRRQRGLLLGGWGVFLLAAVLVTRPVFARWFAVSLSMQDYLLLPLFTALLVLTRCGLGKPAK